MQVKSLKELEKLIQLCQKYEIEKIEIGNLKLQVPVKAPQPQIEHTQDEATEPMTDEDVLNWSTQ